MKAQSGSALVGAVVFTFILSTLGLAYLGFPVNEAVALDREKTARQRRAIWRGSSR